MLQDKYFLANDTPGGMFPIVPIYSKKGSSDGSNGPSNHARFLMKTTTKINMLMNTNAFTCGQDHPPYQLHPPGLLALAALPTAAAQLTVERPGPWRRNPG